MSQFNDIAPPEKTAQENASTLPPNELQSGSGKKAFRVDSSGMWLGDDDPQKAPFYVDMDGNLFIRSSANGGASLKISSADLEMVWNDGKTDRIIIGL